MDQDKQKPADATTEPKVADTPLEREDLDIVVGGLASTGGSAARADPSCVTSAP